MSYMGAYVLWLEEEGLEGMEHVERYHKENPNMIPPKGERIISTFPIKDKEEVYARGEETCPICKQHYNEEEDGYFYRNVNNFNESDKVIYEP